MKIKPLRSLLTLLFAIVAGGAVWAQNGSVTGTVLDENSEALAGAKVMLEGTQKGTLSDTEGKYTISGLEDGDYVLVITYVGYDTYKRTVSIANGGSKKVSMVLQVEAKELDDVVIVGYGVQRRRDLTGNISTIKSEEIGDIVGTSFDATLQGKASGVQVLQGSGYAGSGARIRIRGTSTITAGGEPLYVVDGIPITQDPFITGESGAQNYNPLASINPNDIESIEVLKDAAAAAIYGSRGSNGVILITTKRGKKGKPSVTFSARTGVSRPTRLVDFLSTEEYVQLYLEAWENDGNVGLPNTLRGGVTIDEALKTNTNWYDYTVRTGFKQEYNVGIRGGTEKLSYYGGVNYLNSESFLVGNSYERGAGRLNLDYRPIEEVKIFASTSLSRGQNNRVNMGWAGGFGQAQSTALPYYKPDSVYSTFGYGANPFYSDSLLDWRSIEWRSINTAGFELKPIKDLVIIGNGSYELMDLGDYRLEDSLLTGNLFVAKNGYTEIRNMSGNVTASYNFSQLPEGHNLDIMVGTEAQKATTRSGSQEVTDVYQHLYQSPEANSRSDTVDVVNPTSAWSFASFFGRVNYALKDKYLIKASVRMDGSSRFGPDNKWGVFPAVGTGWIVSEENFWKDNIKGINFFKLKASYGMTGNADIPFDAQYATWALPSNSVNYNNNGTIYPISLGNPALGWETSQTFDVGMEMGLFNDRITTELSYYNATTKDLLLNVALQTSSTGIKTRWDNIGSLRNQGVEFQVTSRNLVGKLKWTTSFNIARNKNEVLDIGTTAPDALEGSGDTRVLPGYPVGVNYLTRVSRIDPDNGLPVFLDADGNETYTWTENNRAPVGDVNPDFFGGITNTFEYNNFDLKFLWTFSVGGNVYDDAAKRQLGVVTEWNMRREILNRWTGPGDANAQYARLTLDPTTYGGMGSEWFFNTDQWLYDATFARLKNITLGYNLPLNPAKRWSMKRMRVFVQATNLVTLTKYPGSDPEVVRDVSSAQARNISPNVTYLTPPQERTFTVGIDLEF